VHEPFVSASKSGESKRKGSDFGNRATDIKNPEDKETDSRRYSTADSLITILSLKSQERLLELTCAGGNPIQSSDLVGSTLIDSHTLVTDEIKLLHDSSSPEHPCYNFCEPF
jgi:hypothetical protein